MIRLLIFFLWMAPIFAKIDFAKDVYPIIKDRCLKCHYIPYTDKNGRKKKPKADLIMENRNGIERGGENGQIYTPYNPSKSPMYLLISLPDNDEDIMPPKGGPLTAKQIETIKKWISEGALFGDWVGKEDHKEALIKRPTNSKSDHVSNYKARVIFDHFVEIDYIKYEKISKSLLKYNVVSGIRENKLLTLWFRSFNESKIQSILSILSHFRSNVLEIDLSRTKIKDKSLTFLSSFENLVILNLYQTEITGLGFKSIQLSKLQNINLSFSKMNSAYIDSFFNSIKTVKAPVELYVFGVDEDIINNLKEKNKRYKKLVIN